METQHKKRGVEKLPYKTIAVHIRIEEELYYILKDYCKAEDKNITDIINSAIDDYLNTTKIDKYCYEY